MNGSSWWTDYFLLVLGLSVFCLLGKGGFLYNYVVWGLYLACGWKQVKKNPTDQNTSEFAGQLIWGIAVCVLCTIISVSAAIKY